MFKFGILLIMGRLGAFSFAMPVGLFSSFALTGKIRLWCEVKSAGTVDYPGFNLPKVPAVILHPYVASCSDTFIPRSSLAILHTPLRMKAEGFLCARSI
jgi:hypothetical protein